MRKTTNYELNIAEGSDRYNHLTIDNPNYEKIDTTMKENEDSAVQTATELKSGTVHAITRNKPNASMFRFVATSDFTSGETFTVDGQQVTALLPNGATLGTGAYHINANVLCCLVGTNMTVYTIGVAENVDASTLEGHNADYFATADALNDVRQTATSAGVVANNAITTANSANATALTKMGFVELWKNPNGIASTGEITANLTNIPANVKYYMILISLGTQALTALSPYYLFSLNSGTMFSYYNGGDVSRSFTALGNNLKFNNGHWRGNPAPDVCIPYAIYAIT